MLDEERRAHLLYSRWDYKDFLILGGGVPVNGIIAGNLIKNQNQPHSKCPVKTRLKAQGEDVLAKQHICGGIYFASDLSHWFLLCIEYGAWSVREGSFYLVLRTWFPIDFHRHATPSDYGWSTHAKDRSVAVRSFTYIPFPPLMQARPLCVPCDWQITNTIEYNYDNYTSCI